MSARSPLQLVLVMLAVLALDAGAAHAERAHVDGQLIVHFKEGLSPNARAATHARAGAVLAERIPAIGVEVVRVGDERAALARYNADPAVRLAELDVLARALHDECSANELCLVPSEPAFPLQWGLQNDSSTIQPANTAAAHDADIDAPYAWRQTTGSAATMIAILDSGIDVDHEDLARKVVASYNATKSRTLDDKYGHGTAVAGVAAPISDNAVGIAGAGFSSSLMNVKVLDDRGIGSCSTVAKGINWAADHGADVINMSLGFADCTAGRRAVDYAWGEKGVVLTAAAGNDGDESATYPAYYANVIAVAATDNADQKTSFSQYGDWVDIAAPGVSVYTTFPNHSNQLGKTNYNYGKGTSMSAPFVAGGAGLLWSVAVDQDSDGRVNDEVRARLESYADDIAGTGTLWRAGRLNVCNAVAASASACPLP